MWKEKRGGQGTIVLLIYNTHTKKVEKAKKDPLPEALLLSKFNYRLHMEQPSLSQIIDKNRILNNEKTPM